MRIFNFAVTALVTGAALFGYADGIELLPRLANAPYAFASEPNAFAGQPDHRSKTFAVKGAGLPDYGRAAALVLTVRATDDDTRAIEIGLHDAKGGVWGSTALPIRRTWSDVTLPFDEMRYFDHWRLPPVDPDALPSAGLLTSLHFCFGKWLCGDSLAKAHGFEVKSVRLVKLPPVNPGADREMLKDSVNFRICGSSTILRDCYADTGKTGYELRGWETRLLGCSYFNNKAFRLDTVTIVRQPSGGRALVSECGFCKNMPHTKVYEGTGSIEWRNMMYSGFGPEDDCPGALAFGRKTGKDQKTLNLAE